jgi:hypothetical protein
VNLNLNDAGRNYVASLFKRDKARLLITHEAKLNELRPQIGRVYGAEQRLKDHFLKHVQDLVSARTDAYIKAYQKYNAELTDSDINEILKELDRLVKAELKEILRLNKSMTPHQDYLSQQFTSIVFSAKDDLELAAKDMKLEAPKVEYHFIEPMPTVDFSFVTDARFRVIIERDYAELQRLDPEAAPKSVLVLSGSMIEGLLIDALVRSGEDEKETFEKFLKQLIHPAKSRSIILHDNITEVLRVFRNLIHPAREIRDDLKFTVEHAKHALTSVDVVIAEVRQWHINHP